MSLTGQLFPGLSASFMRPRDGRGGEVYSGSPIFYSTPPFSLREEDTSPGLDSRQSHWYP